MKCKHIPQIIEYDSYDGNYEEYENAIYAAYQSTFENQELFGTLFQVETLKKTAYQISEDMKE